MSRRARGSDLTDQQERFALEYLKDLNASQAAKRAGSKASNLSVAGASLLANPKVLARIESLKAERALASNTTNADVLSEIDNLAFSDLGDVMDYTGETPTMRPAHTISARARRTIQSVKFETTVVRKRGKAAHVVTTVKEIRLHPKEGMLKLNALHRGLLDERDPSGKRIAPRVVIELV